MVHWDNAPLRGGVGGIRRRYPCAVGLAAFVDVAGVQGESDG